jgi:hypothetical protein
MTHGRSEHEVVHALGHLQHALTARLDDIKELLRPVPAHPGQRLNLAITEVHGRSYKMATLAPIKMLDVEKVLLSVAPQKADGTADDTVTVTWTSSDPSQVGVEPSTTDNGRSCYALTPLETGSATITVAATGYTSDTVDISYAPGTPGTLNLSAGNPTLDTP